jgi:hypothetical protein
MLYQNPAIQLRVKVHLVEEAKGGPSKLLLSFLFFCLLLAYKGSYNCHVNNDLHGYKRRTARVYKLLTKEVVDAVNADDVVDLLFANEVLSDGDFDMLTEIPEKTRKHVNLWPYFTRVNIHKHSSSCTRQ